MRDTVNDRQRSAIAQAIADNGEAEPVLSPDPDALGALVEDPVSQD